ncbi:hypothetical protein DBB_29790 [Desulfoluna spongiiphila]|nr:hypothetical protein DBB_29790 [Desulfoluna spongiiphila]
MHQNEDDEPIEGPRTIKALASPSWCIKCTLRVDGQRYKPFELSVRGSPTMVR